LFLDHAFLFAPLADMLAALNRGVTRHRSPLGGLVFEVGLWLVPIPNCRGDVEPHLRRPGAPSIDVPLFGLAEVSLRTPRWQPFEHLVCECSWRMLLKYGKQSRI